MYLHLGADCSVDAARIIAILDSKLYENVAAESPERQAEGEAEGKAPRSVILTDEAVYFSLISAQSLKKRLEAPLA